MNSTVLKNVSVLEVKSTCKAIPFHSILFNGYLTLFICLVGIFGNILCMVVLSRPRMRTSPINRILVFLSCFDLIFLFATIQVVCVTAFCRYYCIGNYYMYWYHYPVILYFQPIRTIGE